MEHSFSGDRATLGSLIASLNEAFRLTLGRLAYAHGNQPGEWLDALEEEVTRSIKGTVTENIPIEQEAAALKAGLDLVQGTFAELRSELSGRI